MNWAAISFDWNRARAFLAAAEEGSLSAAARALGVSQPTLGRQISALETEIEVVLFERVGRSYVLTPSGAELLPHVRAMAEAANRMALTAAGQSKAIEGTVCISASDLMSTYVLPGFVDELRETAPGIQIDILASNSLSDLLQREADIALRHVRPVEPDLIGKLLRNMTARFYASRTYLDRRGWPRGVDELATAQLVGFGDRDEMVRWFQDFGILLERSAIRHNCASGVVAWQLVREGLGIGVMADDIARRFPDVVDVFPAMEPIRFPLWLVTHRELHKNRRIRQVYDLLAERLGAGGILAASEEKAL
ncbi:LysR family transcriptional regulator [Roseibium sp. RKSG952]|uniref:LysR family transcriptional regulator n=1 Tax=Roseibium sp. RKSG952 TaxID=2529384 RepID=UPI0012BD5A92|nr:LysR family transcriptional regulator [Roseibium sp. RKSG952]MTH99894.1 LysR family transcriptional regulator [Roseibium sp. RKSG952]